jgi:hypothetical protein
MSRRTFMRGTAVQGPFVRLSDGEVIAGELPPTATRLVRQWALARRTELQDNWQRARNHLPLERVAGPDADD